MAPTVDTRQSRWQMEAKRGFAGSLPDWTRADDSDHEYDVTIMRRRKQRSRVRRADSKVPLESDTESDTESQGESQGESDSEKSEDEKDTTVEEAPTTDAPSLAAPTAEGSAPIYEESSMISDTSGLHSNVHKILVGVGSVGGFLLLLGLGFIAWKAYKKRSNKNKTASVDDMAFEKPSRLENLVSKVPFIGSRFGHQGWYTIDDPSQDTLEKKQPVLENSISGRLKSDIFAPSKPKGVYHMGSNRIAPPNFNFDFDTFSPTSTTFVESTAVQVQVVARHDPKESVESLTSRHKRVPSTTPHVYDVGRRQTGFSEISSISSGFGDGDIVVTPTYQTIQSVPSQPPAVATPSRQSTRRSTGTFGRRDTVSTVASMDVRPRFRTVNSWVKQQNGHLRRAERQQSSNSDGDTPPVPVLTAPPEQEFKLMMPDGERPRPVEMV
ncbi:hypothetical protein FZEAL_7492 [Fusarium zealandicum]|uniref:Uncharacterized protein n=1 Tax=Fusarium zealandicum TaxID=1053134 RepID=A0A8H4XIE8_9HYPO|nr:hypothetical protein FZEAL_7492 [Fusarium zealandicum]